MKLTEDQIRMMRHALGLTDGRPFSYRNRYFAVIGTVQEASWNDLVRAGYAKRGHDHGFTVGFFLTHTGATSVLRPGETLDREDFPAGRAALGAQEKGKRT